MAETAHLKLPFLEGAQAQKHVTVNESLRALDALVMASVKDRDLAAPPGSPSEGDRYLVAAAPTGAWGGKAGLIAIWQDGAWAFHEPREGWLLWADDENRLVRYDGAAWAGLSAAEATGLALTLPLPIANGGTGATTAAAARTSLGLGSAAVLNSPVPVANGGTGATTAAAAREALRLSLAFAIADDAVAVIALDGPRPKRDMLDVRRTNGEHWHGSTLRQDGNGQMMTPASSTSAVFATLNNTVLTGTTGADGRATISVTQGTLYVENRLGSTLVIVVSVR